MSTHDEFMRLRGLHAARQMSDKEYADATAALLHHQPAPMAGPHSDGTLFWTDADGNINPLEIVDDSPAARELEILDQDWVLTRGQYRAYVNMSYQYGPSHTTYNVPPDVLDRYLDRRSELFKQLGLSFQQNLKVVRRLVGKANRVITFTGRVHDHPVDLDDHVNEWIKSRTWSTSDIISRVVPVVEDSSDHLRRRLWLHMGLDHVVADEADPAGTWRTDVAAIINYLQQLATSTDVSFTMSIVFHWLPDYSGFIDPVIDSRPIDAYIACSNILRAVSQPPNTTAPAMARVTAVVKDAHNRRW